MRTRFSILVAHLTVAPTSHKSARSTETIVHICILYLMPQIATSWELKLKKKSNCQGGNNKPLRNHPKLLIFLELVP